MTCWHADMLLGPMEQVVQDTMFTHSVKKFTLYKGFRRFITAITTFRHRVRESYVLKMDAVISLNFTTVPYPSLCVFQ